METILAALNGFSLSSLWPLAVGGAVAVAAVTLAPAVLGFLGFTTAGVMAGSLASWFQSTFLGATIVQGSMFAAFQSAGATGVIGGSSSVVIGSVVGAFSTLASLLV